MNFWIAIIVLLAITLAVPLYYFNRNKNNNIHTIAIVLILISGSLGLYFYLGNRAALDPTQTLSDTGDAAQFIDAVQALEKKVRENPDDLQQQIMLARSYRAMGRYEDAVAAYGKSWEAIKDNAQELSLFAGVLAVYRGKFDGKPDELLAQALKIDPENTDALMLAGGSAFEKMDFPQAVALWKRAKNTANLDEEDSQWIETQIAEAQKIIDKGQSRDFLQNHLDDLEQ